MKHFLLSFFILFFCQSQFVNAQTAENEFDDDTAVLLIQEEEVYISPNPASDVIQIGVTSDKLIKKVMIYSILGNMVLEKPVSLKKTIEINVSHLKKGKYLVKVVLNDNRIQVKSLIKN